MIDLSTHRTQKAPAQADRDALVRAFTAWTGDRDVADDLAQETLYAAWSSNRQPEADDEWRPWLFGVARNILLRWRRDQAKHERRVASAPESAYHLLAAAADDDLDALLTRKDIVDILDAALERLPKETRQALLLKYIDDLPQAEIAGRMGVHEKALEGRLHRGKRAVHRFLITERADSAVSLGLVSEPDTWVETGIWCSICGKRQLQGRWFESGDLRLDCMSCDNWLMQGERSHFFSTGAGDQGVPPPFASGHRPSFRVAVDTFLARFHKRFGTGVEGSYDCPRCGGPIRAHRNDHPWFEERMVGPDLHFVCASCGYSDGYSWVPGASCLHPGMVAWEERHQRIRLLPSRYVEIDGRRSIETRWESVDGDGHAEVVNDLESLKLTRIICDGVTVMRGEPV